MVALLLVTHFTVTPPVQEGRDDDALVDFQAAAAEGSGFAKSMLVEMNPYAAMCNAMLRLGSMAGCWLDTGYGDAMFCTGTSSPRWRAAETRSS